MNQETREVLKKYPRTAKALLSVAQDIDVDYAADVINSAKENSPMSKSLVIEAYRKRHCKNKASSLAVSRALAA